MVLHADAAAESGPGRIVNVLISSLIDVATEDSCRLPSGEKASFARDLDGGQSLRNIELLSVQTARDRNETVRI